MSTSSRRDAGPPADVDEATLEALAAHRDTLEAVAEADVPFSDRARTLLEWLEEVET